MYLVYIALRIFSFFLSSNLYCLTFVDCLVVAVVVVFLRWHHRSHSQKSRGKFHKRPEPLSKRARFIDQPSENMSQTFRQLLLPSRIVLVCHLFTKFVNVNICETTLYYYYFVLFSLLNSMNHQQNNASPSSKKTVIFTNFQF